MEYTKYIEKSLRKILIMSILCFVFSLGSLVFYFCYKVEPVTDNFVIELGETVSEDLYDYMTGMDWAVKYSTLDLSDVKQDAVGDYDAYLFHGGQEFHYEITIQDTTPPELVLVSEPVYLKLGDGYSDDKFVASVSDISGDVEIALLAKQGQVNDAANQVHFDECGVFTVEVTAKDASGNIAGETIDVTVDTPPAIEGIREYYIAVGNNTDYLNGVMAIDTVDGDVTSALEVNLGALNINLPGQYEIKYVVVDSYGLETEEEAFVNVMEQMELQEAINTHQINRLEQVIVGSYNLYDSGYYDTDDVDFIQEEMEPAFVQIRPWDSAHGSGFIIEITDEYVLICTNQHVALNKKNLQVYFHEGTMAYGETVGSDKTIDIALVKVKREDIPEELMDTLKTVHINKSYWDGLGASEQISICLRCINSDGTLWKEIDGKLLKKVDDSEYPSWKNMSRLGMSIFSGSSGSAILDGHGNLIAMSKGMVYYYESGKRKVSYWGVHLQDIVDFYEKTMGKPIYYH